MMGCFRVCRLLPLVQQAAHASVVQQPPVCALAPALYPHQIAYQQQQALRPPQQLQMPQQARPPQQQHIPQQLVPAPCQAPMQARLASWQQPQRAGSYDSPSSTLQPFMASHSGAAIFCAALCIVHSRDSVRVCTLSGFKVVTCAAAVHGWWQMYFRDG